MMDPNLQRLSLIAFYFGSNVAQRQPDDPQVVTAVSNWAYRDLSRTLTGMSKHNQGGRKKLDVTESLQGFVSELKQVGSLTQFDDLHTRWCRKAIEIYETPNDPASGFRLHYGQAQKWLNMTLKYLAVLGHPDVSRVYAYLHVPVDLVIYGRAEAIGVNKPKGTSWSRLSETQYLGYQAALRKKISSLGDGTMAPLDWEALAWIGRPDEGIDTTSGLSRNDLGSVNDT